MILRDFLYLDRELVRSFLAQAEGGLVDEATERQKLTGKGGIGGRAGAGPLQVSAEKGKERSLETEAVVRQSAASEFDRLYELLNQDDLVVLDEVSETTVLTEIRRKQILEVDARIQVAGMHQLMGLMGTLGALAPVMQQLGTDVNFDDETLKGIQAISALGSQNEDLPVIGTVAGDCGLKVALELSPQFVMTDTWDVDATVLLKVQRVLKSTESYTVGDPFGGLMKYMAEADRKKLVESLKSDELAKFGVGDAEIASPGFVATPIAIYR